MIASVSYEEELESTREEEIPAILEEDVSSPLLLELSESHPSKRMPRLRENRIGKNRD